MPQLCRLDTRVDRGVFHVELMQGGIQRLKSCGHFGAGNEDLRTTAQQVPEHTVLVVAIELRGQIVQRHDRPLTLRGGMVLGLRQQDRQGHQLGLAPRKRLAAGQG